MSEYRHLIRGDVLPASFLKALQEYIGTQIENVRIQTPSATAVRIPGATASGQAAIGIDGLWRYRSSNMDATVSGAAGIKDLYVTATANSFATSPTPDTDNTDYNFTLVALTSGSTPSGVAAYRKIGEVDWDGAKITGLRQTVGAQDTTLPVTPTAPRPDIVPANIRGAASQAAPLWQAGVTADGDRAVLNAAGQLQLPVGGNTAGLVIGGDAQWYRSTANTMRTPGNLIVDGTTTLTGAITLTGATTFGGQLRVGDGTAAAPGVAFSGATDMGLYRSTTTLGWSIGGSSKMTLTTAGLLAPTGGLSTTTGTFSGGVTATSLAVTGGDIVARQGLTGETKIGSVGPGNEPGVAFGTAGDATVFRDAANSVQVRLDSTHLVRMGKLGSLLPTSDGTRTAIALSSDNAGNWVGIEHEINRHINFYGSAFFIRSSLSAFNVMQDSVDGGNVVWSVDTTNRRVFNNGPLLFDLNTAQAPSLSKGSATQIKTGGGGTGAPTNIDFFVDTAFLYVTSTSGTAMVKAGAVGPSAAAGITLRDNTLYARGSGVLTATGKLESETDITADRSGFAATLCNNADGTANHGGVKVNADTFLARTAAGKWDVGGPTTGETYIRALNTTGRSIFGAESSAGGQIFPGTDAYSTVVGTPVARSLHFATNNVVRLTIDSSGAVTIGGTLGVTGVASGPTAAVDTNTTQLATTAFVLAQAASANPVMDGAVAVGTSTRYARADHVHASDTSRQPLSANLTALAAFSTNGSVHLTAANTFTARTLTGTAGQITVTNGDGVSGNPTVSLPATITQGTTFSGALALSNTVGGLDLSAVTGTGAAGGTGVGDKILLYSTTNGFGIQSNRLVAFVGSGAAFAVRQASGSGNLSSGTDAFTVASTGAVTMTAALAGVTDYSQVLSLSGGNVSHSISNTSNTANSGVRMLAISNGTNAGDVFARWITKNSGVNESNYSFGINAANLEWRMGDMTDLSARRQITLGNGNLLGFFGNAPVGRQAYTNTNAGVRALAAAGSYTLTNVGDVLSTLLFDLKTLGLLG